MTDNKKTFCPECGPSEVSHLLAKVNLALDFLMGILTRPLFPIVRFFNKNLNDEIMLFEYFLLYVLSLVKFIELKNLPSFEKDTDRAKCMWQAGKEFGIVIREVWVLSKPINVFLAKLPNGKKIVFEGLPRPGADSDAMDWMDDKGKMKIKFAKVGFPVPRGKSCFTKKCALNTFYQIKKNGGMAVAKPPLGSRSRHTRVHIKTEEEFNDAFNVVKKISPTVSIEEELRGTVFRVVLIGGELAGVLRRDPPFVVGDGKQTVRELVIVANRDPRRAGPIFHEIPFNEEMDTALRLEKLSKDSVPDLGRKVIVGTKVGRSQGGTNVDVTDEINLENRKLFLDIAKFLKDPLVGIDFIIEDIEKPWRAQMPCGVIELNTVPFLDLHMYPFEGKTRDLSKMLWEEVLMEN